MAERKLSKGARGSKAPKHSGPRTSKLKLVPGLSAERVQERDKLLHDRARLSILGALAVNDKLSFGELKQLTGLTDGNLSVHARRLEDAELVTCVKGFDGRVPRTQYELSSIGRKALERHLDHMERLIRAVKRR